MLLKEKVILITGAGGGLGSTAALALAELGAHIILLDKIIPRLEKIYDAILAAGAPEPVMYPFDLGGANEAEYEELAHVIAGKYGTLDGLLHSALQFNYFAPLSLLKSNEWGHALNVNLNAPFLLTRVLLPVMQNSDHASIVFTSDSSARHGKAYTGAYGVSKIALEGLAKILADELEAGGKVRVNILVPGAVDSPFRQKAYPAEDKTLLAPMTSLKPVYRYLFSDESLGVTGQIIDAQTFNFS